MLHVRRIDRISLKKIRQLTKLIDVTEHIGKLKWNWASHTARMDSGRWPKEVETWKPNGKRRPGRPATRWKDNIETKGGIFWRRRAIKSSTMVKNWWNQ